MSIKSKCANDFRNTVYCHWWDMCPTPYTRNETIVPNSAWKLMVQHQRRRNWLYFAKSRISTCQYYSKLLYQMNENICVKRPGLPKKKSSLTRTYLCKKCIVNQNCAIWDVVCLDIFPWFDSLSHPFVSNTKKFASGKLGESWKSLRSFQTVTYFYEGILMLEKRWIKHTEVKGDCIEK